MEVITIPEPFTPTEAAASMVKRYGKNRAGEYAYGYAISAKYDQRKEAMEYWLQVSKEIDRICIEGTAIRDL